MANIFQLKTQLKYFYHFDPPGALYTIVVKDISNRDVPVFSVL